MKYTEIMIRYGELSTKGKNRRTFINRLALNVQKSLIDFPKVKVIAERDRMHLLLNGEDSDEIIPLLTYSRKFLVSKLFHQVSVLKKTLK